MSNLNEVVRKRMASLNDESLIKIVSEDAGQYSNDALKIANEELLSRNIDIDEVLKQLEAQKEAQRANSGADNDGNGEKNEGGDDVDRIGGDYEDGSLDDTDGSSVDCDEDSVLVEDDDIPYPLSQDSPNGNVFLAAKDYFESRGPDEIPQIRPWARFFARSLDLLLITTILFVILRSFHAESGMQLLGISIVLPVTLLFDGLFLHFWGATPGKWILNIKVTDGDGSRLSYKKAYGRSLQVLLFGEALGINVTLGYFTWLLAYFRLKYLGKTYWDHKSRTTVVHGSIGVVRVLVYVFVTLVLSVFFTASVLYKALQ